MNNRLSRRVQMIPVAESISINQKVYDFKRQGLDVCTLSLGEAFFDLTELPSNIFLSESGFHYGDTQGIPSLREKIAQYYTNDLNSTVSCDDVVVSCGSKPIIYMALVAFCDPGDRILILEPGWLSYTEQASLAGLVYSSVPVGERISDLEHIHVTGKSIRALLLNNPNNPSGYLYSEEELSVILDMCIRNDILLIVDEAYSEFVEDNFVSCASLPRFFDIGIIINSLSKNFGISGWRIGYCLAASDRIEALVKLNQHLITCAPTILCEWVVDNFEHMQKCTGPQIKALIEKRAQVGERMKILGLRTLNSSATFYVFLDISSSGYSSLEFADLLLTRNLISVVPGIAYGKSCEGYIRISIGTEPLDRLYEALSVIKKCINDGFK